MNDDVVLIESRRQLVELTELQAAGLRSLGRQLASSKAYWGDDEDKGEDAEEGKRERTVVRCGLVDNNTYEVRVSEAVGIIALPGLQLIVEPKIPQSHFHHLLCRSPALPRILEDQASAAESTVLWDLVASWYLTSLERILREGLLSDYEETSDLLPSVRGSIRIQDTAVGFYQGSTLLACDYDEFGPDTPLNRILGAAARAITHTSFLDDAVRRRARRCLARLEEAGDLRRTDLQTVLDRRTARYGAPLALARHVLAATGRTFASGSHRAQTFLIRTPVLVEEAVRQILREGLAKLMPVTNKSLQLAGSGLRLNPDLVFGSIAIGDVKYKLTGKDWKRPDLYQAVSFATGYRVDQAAVVTFSATPGTAAPTVRVGDVSLRMMTWDCSPSSTPDSSAELLVRQAREWLTITQGAAGVP